MHALESSNFSIKNHQLPSYSSNYLNFTQSCCPPVCWTPVDDDIDENETLASSMFLYDKVDDIFMFRPVYIILRDFTFLCEVITALMSIFVD